MLNIEIKYKTNLISMNDVANIKKHLNICKHNYKISTEKKYMYYSLPPR